METGAIENDPAGQFEQLPNSYLVRSVAEPRLTGFGDSLFYSPSAKRWIPEGRRQVSPDGRRYAYADRSAPNAPNLLHVVDVTTGIEKVYTLPALKGPSGYLVADFGAKEISLTVGYEGPLAGLWRFDLATGGVRQVAQVSGVWMVDGDTIWVGSVNPADPHPVPGMTPQPDQVLRVGLDGTRQTWLYREGTALSVQFVDAHGAPFVYSFADSSATSAELLLLTAPNTAHVVLPHGEAQPTAIDRYGVWLGGAHGIYLLPDGGTAEKVSDGAGIPAGGCQ